MTRDRVMIVGANGALGGALLDELGPGIAIAATRGDRPAAPGFEHVQLAADGAPPMDALRRCRAVINAAGSITGDEPALEAANVRLPLAIARSSRAAGVPRMVQVSSFAVAGAAECIDDTTPERPGNAYGRSKARGERELAALGDQGPVIESLRLPFIFSAARPGLLSPLLSLSDRLGLLPSRAGHPLRRSMITYLGAARALVACAADRRIGATYAADTRPFDYPLLTRILAEEAERRVRIVDIPEPIVALVDACIPSVGRRLFRSSVLAPGSNRAQNEPSTLEHELRILIRSRYRR